MANNDFLCGMKVLKVVDAEFIGDDGKEVKGQYVYLVPTTEGGKPERVFLSEDRLARMEYQPRFGETVYVFRNDYGRVVDIIKA